jgi:hypothetical protein
MGILSESRSVVIGSVRSCSAVVWQRFQTPDRCGYEKLTDVADAEYYQPKVLRNG